MTVHAFSCEFFESSIAKLDHTQCNCRTQIGNIRYFINQERMAGRVSLGGWQDLRMLLAVVTAKCGPG